MIGIAFTRMVNRVSFIYIPVSVKRDDTVHHTCERDIDYITVWYNEFCVYGGQIKYR